MSDSLPEDTLRTLESLYKFHDRDQVRDFLSQNQTVVSILKDAEPLIEKYFPNSPKSLRTTDDQLAVDVSVRLTAQEAYEPLERLGHKWVKVMGERDTGEVFVQLDYK